MRPFEDVTQIVANTYVYIYVKGNIRINIVYVNINIVVPFLDIMQSPLIQLLCAMFCDLLISGAKRLTSTPTSITTE